MSLATSALQPRPTKISASSILLEVLHEPRLLIKPLGAGSYQLEINERETILTYENEDGKAAGMATWRQLNILKGKGLEVFSCRIEDKPTFPVRGFMLDISRGRIPRREELLRLVNLLAFFKYNQLQLYTEHTFAYEKHRIVWEESGALTEDDIQWLDDVCLSQGIELVPNQNSFGHFEQWLKHSSYKNLAESPDGFEHPISGWKNSGTVLFPSEESADFIEDLLRELLPNFRSNQVNIGGDEPWELGKGRSSSRAAEIGRGELYREHLSRLLCRVEGLGKSAQIWADVFFEEGVIPEGEYLPIIWGYEPGHPFEKQCKTIAASGHDFLVAPGTACWNSFGGRWDVALENIQEAVSACSSYNGKGMLLTNWGDNGHLYPFAAMVLPIVAGGIAAWTGQVKEEEVLSAAASFVLGDSELAALLADLGRFDLSTNAKRTNGSGWFYNWAGLNFRGFEPFSPAPAEYLAANSLLGKFHNKLNIVKTNKFYKVNPVYADEIDLILDLVLEMVSQRAEKCPYSLTLSVWEKALYQWNITSISPFTPCKRETS